MLLLKTRRFRNLRRRPSFLKKSASAFERKKKLRLRKRSKQRKHNRPPRRTPVKPDRGDPHCVRGLKNHRRHRHRRSSNRRKLTLLIKWAACSACWARASRSGRKQSASRWRSTTTNTFCERF